MPWIATALFEPVGVRATYALLGGVGLVVTGVAALLIVPVRKPETELVTSRA
ncbi:hypothetical protein IU470_16155 [Nocardia abscessus]|uniref:Uncharacterized protein n=1 Tax=Nocardia abscessus TaxID=120957 RepID=A0ABS0C8B9_9NOCA|nr:hypothetical protein [Nocardia abscessus]MBF6226628.1 hypothetical protein [Nocardia abscessus]